MIIFSLNFEIPHQLFVKLSANGRVKFKVEHEFEVNILSLFRVLFLALMLLVQ